MVEIGTGVVKLDGDASGAKRAIGEVDAGMKGLATTVRGAGITLQNISRNMFQGLAQTVGVFADFEEAFTGVRKTVEASEQEFQQLERNIREMAQEIPVAATQLSRIGEIAGQLGIDGVDNLTTFIRVIAEMAVSTDLTVESAAISLGKISAITELPIAQARNLASAIVDLGNKFPTFESAIAPATASIAGLGNIVGITAAEMVGLAAAATAVEGSTGRVEAAGNAITKIFLEMQASTGGSGKALETFARLAGLTTKEMRELILNSPVEAFRLFEVGLGNLEDAGSQLDGILSDIGLNTIRVRRTVLNLAAAGDILTDALITSNEAFAEGTALATEAEKFFGTLNSTIQIAKNRLSELAIVLGQTVGPSIAFVLERVGKFVSALADFFEAHPNVARALLVLTTAVAALTGALGTMLVSFAVMRALITVLPALFVGFMGPLGLVTIGFVALAAVLIGIVLFFDKIDDSIGTLIGTLLALSPILVLIITQFRTLQAVMALSRSEGLINTLGLFNKRAGLMKLGLAGVGVGLVAVGATSKDATTSILSMAAGGAVLGATLGSVVPGIGTAFGAMAGGIAGAAGGLLKSFIPAANEANREIEDLITNQDILLIQTEALTKRRGEEETEIQRIITANRLYGIEVSRTTALVQILVDGISLGNGQRRAGILSGTTIFNISEAGLANLADQFMDTGLSIQDFTFALIDAGAPINNVMVLLAQLRRFFSDVEISAINAAAAIGKVGDVGNQLPSGLANDLFFGASTGLSFEQVMAGGGARATQAGLAAAARARERNKVTGSGTAVNAELVALEGVIDTLTFSRLIDEVLDFRIVARRLGDTLAVDLVDGLLSAAQTSAELQSGLGALNTEFPEISDELDAIAQRLANQTNPIMQSFLDIAEELANKVLRQELLVELDELKEASGDLIPGLNRLIENFLLQESTIEDLSTFVKGLTDAYGELEDEISEVLETLISDLDQFGNLVVRGLRAQADAILATTLDGINARGEMERSASENRLLILERERDRALDLLDQQTQAAVGILEAELDALDDIEEAEQRSDIERRLALAFDAKERAKIEQELRDFDRDLQRDAIRDEIDGIEEAAKTEEDLIKDRFDTRAKAEEEALAHTLEILEREREAARETHEARIDDFALFMEAMGLIQEGNMEELVAILDEFVPEWVLGGRSLGEALIEGLEQSGISAFVNDLLARLIEALAMAGSVGGGSGTGGGGSSGGGGATGFPTSLADLQTALAAAITVWNLNPNLANNLSVRNLQGRIGVLSNFPAAVLENMRQGIRDIGGVPQFAMGGSVNQTGLAFLHAGELVLSRQQREQQSTGSTNVRVFIGDRELTDIIDIQVDEGFERQTTREAFIHGIS